MQEIVANAARRSLIRAARIHYLTLRPAAAVLEMVMASPMQSSVKNGVTVHEMKALRLESCRKIFVPRDYAHGLNVHFETQYPLLFRGKISEQTWENTVDTINSIFAEAEKVCFATIVETILGCVTCYCSRLVADTIYQKKMMKLNEFLDRENQETYNPAGFHILSPMERGLRTIEIWVLSDIPSDSAVTQTETSDMCITYPESS